MLVVAPPIIIVIIIIRKSIIMLHADEVGGIVCHARSDLSRRLRVGTKRPRAAGREVLRDLENESGRRSSAKLLTRDEAFLIAVNIAKLRSVPRQILKDIPRPPYSASREREKPMAGLTSTGWRRC